MLSVPGAQVSRRREGGVGGNGEVSWGEREGFGGSSEEHVDTLRSAICEFSIGIFFPSPLCQRITVRSEFGYVGPGFCKLAHTCGDLDRLFFHFSYSSILCDHN